MPHKDPEARRACVRQWKARNRQAVKAQSARRYAGKKDQILAKNAEWAKANRPARRKHCKAWAVKSADAIAEQRRDRRQNPATAQAARQPTRRYAAANPDKIKAKRARRRGAEGSFTAADVAAQRKAQRGRCYYCKEKLERKQHVDHVIPIARGGRNSRDNIVISCPRCNLRKGAKMPSEFAGILL